MLDRNYTTAGINHAQRLCALLISLHQSKLPVSPEMVRAMRPGTSNTSLPVPGTPAASPFVFFDLWGHREQSHDFQWRFAA